MTWRRDGTSRRLPEEVPLGPTIANSRDCGSAGTVQQTVPSMEEGPDTALTIIEGQGLAALLKGRDGPPCLERTTEEVLDCPISLVRTNGEDQACPCEPQVLFRHLWR